MMHPYVSFDGVLYQASQQSRWLRFCRLGLNLAIVAVGLALLAGLGMSLGLITTAGAATAWFIWLVLGTIFAAVVIALHCAAFEEDRRRLAASIEHAHPPLMDRLNTLIDLQRQGQGTPHVYAEAIGAQARAVLARAPDLQPFSPAPVRTRLGVLAAAALATLLFYGLFQPWRHLQSAQAAASQAGQEDAPLEIPPVETPPGETPREDAPWGEVRIISPGGDVQARPGDTVPLEIEAASNRPLARVEWSATVNGGVAMRKELPLPADPRFAVYQPKLDLKELGAKEGDVVSYSARAVSEDGKTFESEVYFVDVAGTKDEPPAASGGQASNDGLSERLDDMVHRQTEVIRQTRRLEQQADESAAQWNSLRDVLAAEEGELSNSARHLSAEAEGEMDAAAAAALDPPLQQSAARLGEAQQSLRSGSLEQSRGKEESALSALVAARRQLREQLAKNSADQAKSSKGSDSEKNAANDDGSSPESLKNRLDEQIARLEERRRQIQDLRKTVQDTLAGERNLQASPDLRNPNTMPKAAQRQRELQNALNQSAEKNASCMGNSKSQMASAKSAMEQAAQAMEGSAGQRGQPGKAGQPMQPGQTGQTGKSRLPGQPGQGQPGQRQPGQPGPGQAEQASNMAGQAADELQKLDDALEREEERAGLAAAHQLKRSLEHQIVQLSRGEQQGMQAGQAQQLAGQSKSTVGKMKRLAEEKPTSDRLGQPLRDALGESNKRQLDAQSNQLGQAQDAAGRRQAAGQLGRSLAQVSQAFDASCPGGAGRGRGSPSKSGQSGSVAKGAPGPAGTAKRSPGVQMPPEKAGSSRPGGALTGAEGGQPGFYGSNTNTPDATGKRKEEAKPRKVVIDIGILESLIRQFRPAPREADSAAPPPATAENQQTYIDPSTLPPAYRKSIERYFQTLSEQR